MKSQDFKNAGIVAFVMLLVTAFIASNIDLRVGTIDAIFAIIALFFFFVVVNQYKKLSSLGNGIEFGSSTDWVKDIVSSFLYAIIFFVISSALPSFAIGIPNMGSFAVSGQTFATVVVLSPVLEELVFRGAIQGALLLLGIPTWAVIGLASASFAGFHYYAYTVGGYVSAVNPFIGAFLFGIFASVIVFYRKNLLSSMVLHGIINLIVVSKLVIAR